MHYRPWPVAPLNPPPQSIIDDGRGLMVGAVGCCCHQNARAIFVMVLWSCGAISMMLVVLIRGCGNAVDLSRHSILLSNEWCSWKRLDGL
jgi:hypothetical protein